MKICVTSTGQDMDSAVDSRFGRCQFFVLVDEETMEYEAIPNSAANDASGAGIQAAHIVADMDAGVVITGHTGPNATQMLTAAQIRIMTGASGTVRDAALQYKSGKLAEVSGPTAEAHAGAPDAGADGADR